MKRGEPAFDLESFMKQLLLVLLFSPLQMAVSFESNYSWIELVQQEEKGYTITLDNTPIKLCYTYLNKDNILEIKKDRKRKRINIIRKDKSLAFYSVAELKAKNNYPLELQYITVDGRVLNTREVLETKFESESINYLKLLTQDDYKGKEFDDLPQVKQAVGKGILIIETRQ